MSSITERAAAVIKAEAAARLVADQATQAAAASAAAEKDRLEREARIIAAAERQQALLRAERLEAEQTAAAAAAAEQTALAAEVARLRARTPLEVLQDEMAEMKRLLAARPAAPRQPQQLRIDGELDMRFKSSREEVAALREALVALSATVAPALAEIKQLKRQMATLASRAEEQHDIALKEIVQLKRQMATLASRAEEQHDIALKEIVQLKEDLLWHQKVAAVDLERRLIEDPSLVKSIAARQQQVGIALSRTDIPSQELGPHLKCLTRQRVQCDYEAAVAAAGEASMIALRR